MMSRLQMVGEAPGHRSSVEIDEGRGSTSAGQPEEADEDEERDRLDEDQPDEDTRSVELRELRPGRRPSPGRSVNDWNTSTMSGARTRTVATCALSTASVVTDCGEAPCTR